ncbi:MAG: alpha/beta fold hydrolase, partial [Sciscionella sp.]
PAVGLAPTLAGERASVGQPLFEAPWQARQAQRYDWPTVAEEVITAELEQHLVKAPGGYRFRYHQPAVSTAWSEMCRAPMLPPAGLPTLVVPALQADYVREALIAGLRLALGDALQVSSINCGHSVHLERPADVGELIRGFLPD